MSFRRVSIAAGVVGLFGLASPPLALAQQPAPAPPQGYPPPQAQPAPQPYPQLPPPAAPPQQQPPPGYPAPQPYPPQQAPAPQPYPQQGPAPQPYPPQGQPYPQAYPPPQQPPPQQYQQPPPGYPAQPPPYAGQQPYMQPAGLPLAPPVSSSKRGDGEMAVLYGTSIAWGVGTGIWIDVLANTGDPGIEFIAPLAFGAAAPLGVFLLDNYQPFDRGVPASISTGLALGAMEGIAISSAQWEATGEGAPGRGTWSTGGQGAVTWIISTAGGVGGYAFGEWFRPDPRSLAFIASGAGWGAISGSLIGAGAASGDSNAWKGGASVGGLLGYNLGLVADAAIGIAGYTPSWRTQQAMWLGYLLGTVGASVVYLFYIGNSNDPRHGLIANGVGGLAGIGVAAALTANMKDPDQTSKVWTPPFQLGLAPTPTGGAVLAAYGTW